MTTDKPPIGIKGKKLWIEERGSDLINAINRYYNWGGLRAIPEMWVEELYQLIITEKDQ